MDMLCFYGGDKSKINVMSATFCEFFPAHKARDKLVDLMQKIPKSRYSVVNIMGDLYYKELSAEVAAPFIIKEIPKEKWLKNDKDIN